MARPLRAVVVALACFAAGGCARATEDARLDAPNVPRRPPSEGAEPGCPPTAEAPFPLPRIAEEELELGYWLERAATLGDLDEVLLDPDEIDAHNEAIAADGEDLSFARRSLASTPPAPLLLRELRERLLFLRERLQHGSYVRADGSRIDAASLARFDPPDAIELEPALRIAVARIPLRCGPLLEPLHSSPPDPAFDRNACSTIERQEPVQVLARGPEGLLLARTRYALGWIAADAALSPPVPAPDVAIWTAGARARLRAAMTLRSEDGAQLEVDPDVLLPVDPAAPDRLRFATRAGFHTSVALGRDVVEPVRRPLTRRAFLVEAFRHAGAPYGWGGRDGGLDCSELVMDVLATFGIDMPRHSARQALAGTFSIPIPAEASERDRLSIVDAAARRGIVLLHMPGHVMIWLGRNRAGEPRVLHAFAEYLEPCPGGGETLRRVRRVTVSDLELGRGTSRRAFLERIDRVVVLGREPGPELSGLAVWRAAARVELPSERACADSVSARIFHSPAMPHAGAPLRFVLTSSRDPGPLDVALRDPSGRLVRPEVVHRLGGPPYSVWVEIPRPAPGRWTMAAGDGARLVACDRVTVARHPRDASDALPLPVGPERTPVDPHAAIWTPRWRWEEDTENFYAAFVEQLFEEPDEHRTWRSLSELLRDRGRNLLYDHLGMDEDARLELVPDCADLPYFLRAYFAWKLRLPFAFRRCSRGRAGVPPSCGELVTTAIPHEAPDEVEAFRYFVERHLRSGVHSASGRTSPRDDATDLYPVPLTRQALRPGTVFADPYGHLLVLTHWVPQGASRHGSLIAADAQPDGTIGRRTFWRGTFLFTPDTTDVGAGFKAWRPVIWDLEEDVWTTPTNEELRSTGGPVPWSVEQYRGSLDDFYDRMEMLINPRALDAEAMQLALIDALQESVARRVVSVDNGEQWFRAHPGATIEMPEGTGIFLTEGPWEDYSTPSRDMRLLVAIDTVVGFTEAMRRRPARWGLAEGPALEEAVERVRALARRELETRRFAYTRSDGSRKELTLAELVARAEALEIAWNPNDCVEIRWGAPEGSPEASTCRRRAPAEQRARMQQMRAWFAERRRPTR